MPDNAVQAMSSATSVTDDPKGRVLALALQLVLVTAPLVIGLAWGTTFDDSAYATFRYAHNLAAGRGLVYDLPVKPAPGVPAPELCAPLYALALWLPAKLGMPLPQAGLLLSALGWGAAALAIYRVGRAMGNPVAAAVSAALAAFNPTIVSTLGTEVSWAVAFAWIAVVSSADRRWGVQNAALVLMLYTRFDLGLLAITALLLILQGIRQRRFPLRTALVLVAAALGRWLLAIQGAASPLPAPHLGLDEWRQSVRQLLDESEFYWLFISLAGVGLASAVSTAPLRKALWAGLVWAGVAALSGGIVAKAIVATLGALLVGLGTAWVIEWIASHNVVRLSRPALTVGLALVAGLPLGIAQTSSLVQRYQLRPVTRQALEQSAADWLHTNSEPTATVLGPASVGYLADRATFPWDEGTGDRAEVTSLVEALAKQPPTYCVSSRSLTWDRLTHTGWFQDGYASLRKLRSPYEARSPLTIWGYTHAETPKPVEATFGGQIALLSFGAADSLAPGTELEVRLYWQALTPPEEDYIVFVHLLDANGQPVTGHDGPPMDGECPTSTWLPGDVVPDVHQFALEPAVPVGTYNLWVGIYAWPSIERLPVWDNQGVEQANQILFLQPVEVR
jgi:hypothetical protein